MAFLFLTRGELHHPAIWSDYFSRAVGNNHRVFAHTKARGFLREASILHNSQIDERIETTWGNASLVNATLSLLKEAMDDTTCTHFVLVSESCVPVRPLTSLITSLTRDTRSRMRVQPWEEVRKWNILKAQRLEYMPGIRKEIAHFQDQWMCLNREDASLVTTKDWTPSFEKVFAPDECYFATVMAASGKPPLQAVANRPITWTEWKQGEGHPQEYRDVPSRVAAQIADSGCFFARKFAPGSDIAKWGLHLG